MLLTCMYFYGYRQYEPQALLKTKHNDRTILEL